MFTYRLPRAAVVLVAAMSFVAAAEAAPATLSVSRIGDKVVVFATAEVAANSATTWDVLTSYDHLSEFIPDMSASRTLKRDGSNALVSQSGSAGLGPFTRAFNLTLAVHEERQQSVTARAVAGDFSRFESSYRLRTDELGHTRIEYSAVMEPKGGIPPLVGLPVMRSSIRAQFEALLAEIDRRGRLANRP